MFRIVKVRLAILVLALLLPLVRLLAGLGEVGDGFSLKEKGGDQPLKSAAELLQDNFKPSWISDDDESFNGPEMWQRPVEPIKSPDLSINGENLNSTAGQATANASEAAAAMPYTVPIAVNTGNRVVLKMSKDNIILLQKALNKAGFYPDVSTGMLDDHLVATIKEFQKYTGLEPDGVVDREMIKFLDIYAGGCESAYALKISIAKN